MPPQGNQPGYKYRPGKQVYPVMGIGDKLTPKQARMLNRQVAKKKRVQDRITAEGLRREANRRLKGRKRKGD